MVNHCLHPLRAVSLVPHPGRVVLEIQPEIVYVAIIDNHHC